MTNKEKNDFVNLICEMVDTDSRYYTATRDAAMKSVVWYIVNNYDVKDRNKNKDNSYE
jgi:hypothetical protein